MTEHKNESVKKFLSNYWAVASVVLAVVLVVVFIVSFMNMGIGKKVAGEKVETFLNDYLAQNGQPGTVNISNVEKVNGMYQVNISYQGNEIPAVYITLDGKYITSQLIPTTVEETQTPTEEPVQTEVQKSDKPVVDLFVMSYCPYGTQAEKGIIPVFKLLGNKIEGNIRFVHYTMHGEKEDTENYRQLCIREIYGQDKFLNYLACILNSTDVYTPGDQTACMKKFSISTSSIDGCIAKEAVTYNGVDSDLSNKYGVQGSPTLVINGVQVSSGRDSSSLLKIICAAFNEQPAECSETLSSASPSPGFGYNSAGDSAAAASCGQ